VQTKPKPALCFRSSRWLQLVVIRISIVGRRSGSPATGFTARPSRKLIIGSGNSSSSSSNHPRAQSQPQGGSLPIRTAINISHALTGPLEGSRWLLSRHLRHGVSRVQAAGVRCNPGIIFPRRHVCQGDHCLARLRAAPREELFTVSLGRLLTSDFAVLLLVVALAQLAPSPPRARGFDHGGTAI